jgi:type II secretory pathway pseudopilin PulG
MRLFVALLAAVCALPGSPQAQARAEEESAVTRAAKQMGSDAKKMGKQVGRTGKKVGKDIGKASTRTAKTIKREFREDFIEGRDNDPPPQKRKVDRQGRR